MVYSISVQVRKTVCCCCLALLDLFKQIPATTMGTASQNPIESVLIFELHRKTNSFQPKSDKSFRTERFSIILAATK